MSYLREHDAHVNADGVFASSVFTLGSHLGTLQAEQCDTCPYWYVACLHDHCAWDLGGKTLLCRLCGADGT